MDVSKSKDYKIWLVLGCCKPKGFDFFQILEYVGAVWIFVDLYPKPVNSSVDLSVEETISEGNLVSKAVLSLYLLEHSLDRVHTPMNPVFGEPQPVCLELCLNLFEQT